MLLDDFGGGGGDDALLRRGGHVQMLLHESTSPRSSRLPNTLFMQLIYSMDGGGVSSISHWFNISFTDGSLSANP